MYASVGELGGGDGTSGITTGNDRKVAACKSDLDLTIAWGMAESMLRGDDDLKFDWAGFPDPKVSINIVDVLWRGAPVERAHYPTVDGGRASLSLGTGHDGLEISRFESAGAKLVDGLKGGSHFRSYVDGVPYRLTD